MESLRVERLDHFGLIACAIKDLGLNELPRSKLRGIKPPFAYTRVPPVWRGDTRVACEP